MLTKIQGKIVMRVRPFQMAFQADGAGFKVTPRGTRPVFLLTFVDGTERVLKAEFTDQSGNEGAEFIASLQSMVGADLGVVPLDATDVAALSNMKDAIVHGAGGVHPRAAAANAFIKDIATCGQFIFYTMTYVSTLKSLESSEKKQTETNGEERALERMGAYKLARKMITDKALLPALGKVVAVDLFCGNFDRFGPDGSIVNTGNIMFRKNADKTYTPLGVDFFDVQNEFSKMTTPLRPDQARTWPGRMLRADKAYKLDVFASMAIMSLNANFVAAMGTHAMPSDGVLGGAEVNALKAGIIDGAYDLRKHLITLQRRGRMPAGVQSRMDMLGWATGWVSSTTPTQQGNVAPPRPLAPSPSLSPGTPIRGLRPRR